MIKGISHGAIIFLLAFIVIFVASVANDPEFRTMSRDGGAFAYCGWRITQGAVLYRDCWDNKTPAVYYLNAAVIAVGGTSQWNIWMFQAIWLSITALAFFSVLKKIWSGLVALVCTFLLCLTLLYPVYFSNGNLTETYALLPITLILGSFWGYLTTRKSVYLVGIGLCTALAFLFKPTYISMSVGVILTLIFLDIRNREYRVIIRQLLITGLGFFIPLLLTASYWIIQGDLKDFLYAIFVHNQLYVEQGFTWKAVLVTVRVFILEQPLAALFALAMIGMLAYVVEKWNRFYKPDELSQHDPEYLRQWVMVSLIITFILDFIFITLPGTNFRHYYQIPILTLAALAGFLFDRLSQAKFSFQKNNSSNVIMYSAILLILIPWLVEVIGKEFPSQAYWKELFSNSNITQYQPNNIEQFILENTTPDQSILIWDYDPSIYFHVSRRSSTRFIFLRHLYTPIPGAANGFSEFMQDLQNDPPALIISKKTSQQGLPYLGFNENDICSDCTPDVRAGVVAFKRYVSQYYQAYTDIETWAVYTRLK